MDSARGGKRPTEGAGERRMSERSGKVGRCPDCGGIIALDFPIHECKVPLSRLSHVAAPDGYSISLSGAGHRKKVPRKARK